MEISFILIQKEKRKKGKAQGKAQDSKQKQKKKTKRRKKKHLAGFEPPALSPEDLSFSAPHTIRPRAHGRVTSFPAYTNLTDIYDRKLHTLLTLNATTD